MHHTKKIFLSLTIMGALALSASPAVANSDYGGTGSGTDGSTGYGSSNGSSTYGSAGTSVGGSSTGSGTLAFTGSESSDLALGGAILAGTGATLAWGVRRKRLAS